MQDTKDTAKVNLCISTDTCKVTICQLRQVIQNCGRSLRAKDFKLLIDFLECLAFKIQCLFDAVENMLQLMKNFVEEAPKDGKIYGRQNGRWVPISCGNVSIYFFTLNGLTSYDILGLDANGGTITTPKVFSAKNSNPVGFAVKSSPSWVTDVVINSDNTLTITYGVNESYDNLNTGVIELVQFESGYVITINLTQACQVHHGDFNYKEYSCDFNNL